MRHMRILFTPLLLLAALFCQGQALDTTKAEDRSKFYNSIIGKYRILNAPAGSYSRAFNALRILASGRVPNLTLADVKAGQAGDAPAFNLIRGKQSGLYVYDAADATTAEDTALTIRYNNRRYKRQIVNNEYYPEFWNAAADGVANDVTQLQRALDAAWTRKGVTVANGTYTIRGNILVRANLRGTGTIKTTNGATINIGNSFLTISGLTIDGTNNTGRGVFLDGPTYCTLDGLQIRNTSANAIWCRRAHYTKVVNCVIDGPRGSNGDAIYFSECKSPQVIGNLCRNYERIGLVLEGKDSTSAAPTNLYTSSAVVVGNTFEDAVENADPVGYPNAAIWGENVAGVVITGNTIRNMPARGIVLSPSIIDNKIYEYIVSNNTIANVYDSGNLVGTGLAFSFADNQVLNLSGNILTDCRRGIEAGRFLAASITNNIFNAKNRPASWFSANIFLIMMANQPWVSTVNIANCINNIPGGYNILPVSFSDVFGQKMNFKMSNCIGNFAFAHTIRTIIGDFVVKDCTLDYSSLTSSGLSLFNISGLASYDNCDITMQESNQMAVLANEFRVHNTRISASTSNRIFFGAAGPKYTYIDNSRFSNVRFYDIRRAETEIYLRSSWFDGYHTGQGLFENTVTQLKRLEVMACTFSRTILQAPIQFAAGVAEASIGPNIFYGGALYQGFVPANQSRHFSRGSGTQKPATPHIGYRYFNNDNNREEYYNGVEWLVTGGGPVFMENSSTTAPSASGLNTLYGNLKAGSVVFYLSASGGAREYQKVSDSPTSKWIQTIHIDGSKSTLTP